MGGRGRIRVGTSGWRYPPWRGNFYPAGLPQRRELSHLAEKLDSVEINGSFYSLQRPSSYQSWRRDVSSDFIFAVKGSRFITHMKKLRGVDTALANFFGSGVLALGDTLGPFLWQLPPTLGYDAERLAEFFAQLPRTTAEAATLAEKHDSKLTDRAWTTAEADVPLRHALEVRHPSFERDDLPALLAEQRIALVVADTAGTFPQLEHVTTDFVYVRLHGDEELYVSGYSEKALDDWATKTRGWADSGRDVYVYFDNDAKVHAPRDAISLARRLNR